jgi:hypothetical protein
MKLEQKVNEVEENLLNNIESLESKYSLLKDQLTKFTKLIEEDKESKDRIKNKSNDEIKHLEGRIKNMFNEEREYMKNYVENSFNKLAEQLHNYENNSKKDNDALNNNLMAMKE